MNELYVKEIIIEEFSQGSIQTENHVTAYFENPKKIVRVSRLEFINPEKTETQCYRSINEVFSDFDFNEVNRNVEFKMKQNFDFESIKKITTKISKADFLKFAKTIKKELPI